MTTRPVEAASAFFQSVRPSGHSAVIIASHVSFLMSLSTAYRSGQTLEFASLCLSLMISIGYHVCDENVYCSLGLRIEHWHALDVWSTFFLICFVIGVRAMNFQTSRPRTIARCMYVACITMFVIIDRGSVALFGTLLFSVAAGLVVRHLVWGAGPNGDMRYLVMGLGVFACSLGCFVLANTPIIGPVTWQGHGMKPMDVPDTAVYWAFHSVWHFASAISAHFLLKFNSVDRIKGV